MVPLGLPPWHAACQGARRWPRAGRFEAAAHDPRELLRLKEGREPRPTAAILDGRVLRSAPESGRRAGYGGHRRARGSKAHLAAGTLGCPLALVVTPANVDERRAVAEPVRKAQEETGQSVEPAWVDQGHVGEEAAAVAAEEGVRLGAVSLPEAEKGLVLLPRRWVVERGFAWSSRLKRLAKGYERLPEALAGLRAVVPVHPHACRTGNLATGCMTPSRRPWRRTLSSPPSADPPKGEAMPDFSGPRTQL